MLIHFTYEINSPYDNKMNPAAIKTRWLDCFSFSALDFAVLKKIPACY